MTIYHIENEPATWGEVRANIIARSRPVKLGGGLVLLADAPPFENYLTSEGQAELIAFQLGVAATTLANHAAADCGEGQFYEVTYFVPSLGRNSSRSLEYHATVPEAGETRQMGPIDRVIVGFEASDPELVELSRDSTQRHYDALVAQQQSS